MAATNPMVTDIFGSAGPTPPAAADPTVSGNPYSLLPMSNHREGSRVLGVNQVFAGGHVEFHPRSQVRPYYLGNWWNWR